MSDSTPANDDRPRYRSGEFPVGSRADERAAAAERRRAFPYRFPRDSRQLGGAFSVEENSRRLLRYFYFERRLAQAIGSWTLTIPEFEVKLETGGHMFWHADAARLLRERFHYQGQIRAVGDVLREQAGFMVRCGFDAFEPSDGATPEVLTKAANRFRHVYQRAADNRAIALDERAV